MITEEMKNTLDSFFASKTIVDVDRNTFLICNLKDKPNKLTISLVFLRDWHSLESDSYNYVAIEGSGAVFTFPCYWASVPKELAMPYIMEIIQTFYDEVVSGWKLGDGSGSGSSSSGNNSSTNQNNGCLCPPCGAV